MPTASARTQTIVFTGDTTATQVTVALNNPNSPAVNEIQSLVAGANTIVVPGGGSTPVAVTIVPPAGNVVPITLQGVAGDAGILLHPTDPTTIALGASVTTFALSVTAPVTGMRFIWS